MFKAYLHYLSCIFWCSSWRLFGSIFSHTILFCHPTENNMKNWENLVYFIFKYLLSILSCIWAPLIYSFSGIMENFNEKCFRNNFMVAFVYQSGNFSLSIYGENRLSKNMTTRCLSTLVYFRIDALLFIHCCLTTLKFSGLKEHKHLSFHSFSGSCIQE